MLHGPILEFGPSIRGGLRLALVLAEGLRPGAPSRAGGRLDALLAEVAARGEAFLAPSRKAAVRDLLRRGSYKPAGRAKPSSEYLLAAALEGAFPRVNGAVDANNAASLAFGYPASVFDRSKCGERLLLEPGRPGDSYVFNASGQGIDLADLLCVWRRRERSSREQSSREPGSGEEESLEAWEPIGNPVKDAMVTKVFGDSGSVVGVVYAPSGPEGADLEACASLYAELLRGDCGASEASYSIFEAAP